MRRAQRGRVTRGGTPSARIPAPERPSKPGSVRIPKPTSLAAGSPELAHTRALPAGARSLGTFVRNIRSICTDVQMGRAFGARLASSQVTGSQGNPWISLLGLYQLPHIGVDSI